MPRSVASSGASEGLDYLGGRRAGRGFPIAIPTVALWLLLAAALAGFAAIAHQYRVEIVRGWPQAASLYGLFGIEVNSAGIEFRDVTYNLETEDGLSVFAVRGSVMNVTDQALAIPRVRLSLRDEAGIELYHWTIVLDQTRLDPNETANFVTRLSSPPPGASDLEVRFAEGPE